MILGMIYEPKIALLIHIWDDPRGLTRIFQQESTWNFDAIFIFDGKFSMYKGKQEFEDLEVFNVVEDWAKTKPDTDIFYTYFEDNTEAQKRNKGFWFAGKHDIVWAVVCDSDEYPEWDREAFLEECKYLDTEKLSCFPVNLHHYTHTGKSPRLFYKPSNIYIIQEENKLSHSSIYNGTTGKEITQEISGKEAIKSLRLYHDRELQSKARTKAMDEYARVINH